MTNQNVLRKLKVFYWASFFLWPNYVWKLTGIVCPLIYSLKCPDLVWKGSFKRSLKTCRNPVLFHNLGEGLWLQSRPITADVVCRRDTSDWFWLDQSNSAEHQLLCKMRGLLFLLSALLLLESTDGHKEYHQLSKNETNIIDRAIQLANEKHGKTKHLDFALISEAVSYLIIFW